MLAAANGGDPGVLDILGGREIGLPYAERNDVAALSNQIVHFRQHDERVLRAEVIATAADRRNDHRRAHRSLLAA